MNEGLEIRANYHFDCQIWSAKFSSDGAQAFVGRFGALDVWDHMRMEKRWALKTGTYVADIGLNPQDPEIVVACDGALVNVYNVRLGKSLTGKGMKGHRGEVDTVAFSHDGKVIFSGGKDKKLRFWSPENYKCFYTINDLKGRIYSLAASPNSDHIASGSGDNKVGKLRIWDIETQKSTVEYDYRGRKKSGDVPSVSYNNDGNQVLFTTYGDCILRVLDVRSGKCILEFEEHEARVYKALFNPAYQDQLASSSGDKTVRLWDVRNTERSTMILTKHTGLVLDVAYRPDGKELLSVGADNRGFFWNLTPTLQGKTSSAPVQGDDPNSVFISSNRLTIGDVIGRGGFGEIRYGELKVTGILKLPVAVKYVEAKGMNQVFEDFAKEIGIHAGLDHPNVVKLYGITKEEPFGMVMEFMKYGSLHDLLSKSKPTDLKPGQCANLGLNILEGLNYLHSNDSHVIVHGDLKSLNILLDEHGNAKLADFGLAAVKKLCQESNVMKTSLESGEGAGSILWMAPEQFETGKKTRESDMYSCGVVLWEIVSHKTPFFDVEDKTTIPSLKKKGESVKFSEELTPNCHPKYSKIAKECLAQDPRMRITSAQALVKMRKLSGLLRDVGGEENKDGGALQFK